jgi:hypothetical protein
MLLSGYFPELVYARGGLDRNLPFEAFAGEAWLMNALALLEPRLIFLAISARGCLSYRASISSSLAAHHPGTVVAASTIL